MLEVRITPDFESFRSAARHLLLHQRPPGRVLWVEVAGPAGARGGGGVLPGLAGRLDLAGGGGGAVGGAVDGAVDGADAGGECGGGVRVPRRGEVRVPRAFVETARRVACHRDPQRWALLYRVLWRLVTTEPQLLTDAADPDVRRLALLDGQIRRDVHKMHAFVRFRKVAWPDTAAGLSAATPAPDDGAEQRGKRPSGGVAAGGVSRQPLRERFVAWYEPDHRILRLAAPFFAERFASLDWAILTPDGSAVFDGGEVRFGPPPQRPPRDLTDDLEQLWCGYYAAVFNPNRVKVAAMTREMPRRFWKNLPETHQIDDLLAAAPGRAAGMTAAGAGSAGGDGRRSAGAVAGDARPFVPSAPPGGRVSLRQLYDALPSCRGCGLCENGTRPVAGEGPSVAGEGPSVAGEGLDVSGGVGGGGRRVLLVGEQPGDTEVEAGRPFVGPAGAVLERALAAAGLDRRRLYITNAVKHFRHELRGKRRIHLRPTPADVRACRPWLEAECRAIQPDVVVALGTTAARSMLGPAVSLQELRGRVLTDTEWAPHFIVTHHPSAVLRAADERRGRHLFDELVAHLTRVAAVIAAVATKAPPPDDPPSNGEHPATGLPPPRRQ